MKIWDYVLLVCKKKLQVNRKLRNSYFLVGSSKTLHKCAKGEDTGQQSDLVFKDEMRSYPKCPVKTLRIITIYCVSSPRAAFPLLSITMSSNPLKSKLSVNIWVGCFVPRMTNEVHFVASKKKHDCPKYEANICSENSEIHYCLFWFLWRAWNISCSYFTPNSLGIWRMLALCKESHHTTKKRPTIFQTTK